MEKKESEREAPTQESHTGGDALLNEEALKGIREKCLPCAKSERCMISLQQRRLCQAQNRK